MQLRTQHSDLGKRDGGLPTPPSASGTRSGLSSPEVEGLSPGYALLLVMMAVTVLLVSLTAALPSAYREAQREREEELLFRGNQYARAIAQYHARFARYPSSVDDLLKKTNGFRFLRRPYKDPMTKSGNWRFIHTNGAGVLLDSKTMNVQAGVGVGAANSPLGGSNSLPGNANGGTLGLGLSAGAQPPAGAGNTQTQSSGDTSGGASAGATQGSSGFLNGTQLQGGFIAGVASTSKKQSIRVWNGKTRYDEWEFLGIQVPGTGSLISPPGAAGAPAGSGTQPGAPGQFQTPPQTMPQPQPPPTENPQTLPEIPAPTEPDESQPPAA